MGFLFNQTIWEADFFTITLLSGLLFLVSYVILNGKLKSRNLPPGPFPLPFIGNLHHLGLKPFKTFMTMRKKYGDVFLVYFGSYPTIVLNGSQIIKKYFNLSQVAGRPQLLPLVKRSPEGIPAGIGGTEGDEWLEQRRFVIRNLRDFGFGKGSTELLIMDEVSELINTFHKTLGKPVVTQNVFSRAVVNSLYKMCLGERCTESDEEFESILHSIRQSIQETPIAGLVWFFPKISQIFPKLSGFQNILDWSYPMLKTLNSQYHQHKRTFHENSKRDLIDCYVSEIQNTTDINSSFYGLRGERNMEMSLQDLLIAGSETTSTTLSWTFLILALYPDIQEKLQMEIDKVIGNAKPCLSHRADMPYYQCLILEILRYTSIAPLGIFHGVTETTEIEGFTIHKGTLVIANLYGVHRDPDVWGSDVDEIRPERFLSHDGKTVVKNHEGFMAFSTGKRVCLGEGLARDTLFLFITSIFQLYDVYTNPDGPKPTLDYHIGTTLSPLKHEILLKERKAN